MCWRARAQDGKTARLGKIFASICEQLKQGILGWQYWIDQIEGTKPDNHFEGGMEVWTENHQMDFHVSESLAGMLYPDEMFWGTNMTGRQHADTGRGFVTRWLERRYRWGFSEWRSATYYQFCFHSVTTLASLAPEPLVATRAGIVLDLMMLDVSMHSLHGMLASSQVTKKNQLLFLGFLCCACPEPIGKPLSS